MSAESDQHIAKEPSEKRNLGTRIVERVREAVNEQWQEINSEHRVDAFTSLYLRPRERCVPDWFLSDEILDDIIDLYHHPLAAIRDELSDAQQIWPGAISLCVMPSWESNTISVAYTSDRVLLSLSQKAWSFWWESEEEMGEELTQWYAIAEQGLTQESRLSEGHRQALMEVLGQAAVLLPGEGRVRVIDQARLQASVEELRQLI